MLSPVFACARADLALATHLLSFPSTLFVRGQTADTTSGPDKINGQQLIKPPVSFYRLLSQNAATKIALHNIMPSSISFEDSNEAHKIL